MLCLDVEFRRSNEKDRKEIRRNPEDKKRSPGEESESVVSHGTERSSTG